MRALFTSTQGTGHFNPLVPFARAFERAGHEVMFAGPPALGGSVEAAGFRFWQFDAPPEDELGAIWARVPELPPDDANIVVIGEIFGRLNTTAALPKLRAAIEEWRPDVVLRDPNEYAGAVAAELHARAARPRGHLPGLERGARARSGSPPPRRDPRGRGPRARSGRERAA